MSDYYSDEPAGSLFSHFVEKQRPTPEPKSIVADMRHRDRLPSSERRKRAVELLTQQMRTCEWLDKELYRGQAVICELRQSGHIINTVRIEGVNHYQYIRKVDVVKVTPTMKELYYKTRHWIAKAAERKRFDGNQCCQCKATSQLETHHWRYHFFNECVVNDLMTLCKPCHDMTHEAVSGSAVHFPKTMHKDAAERLFDEFPQCRGDK